MSIAISELKEKFIENYCKQKGYQFSRSEQNAYIRVEVANLTEKISLNIYQTGALTVGGSPKAKLNIEFKSLKEQMENSPEMLAAGEIHKKRSCSISYTILLPNLREKIKNALSEIDSAAKYYENPTPSEEYRAKLTTSAGESLSVTQYKNGTLFLQGKEDSLFDSTCSLIEKIASPETQEIIIRFIASDEDNLQKNTLAFTPKLLEEAENNIKKYLGDAYSFLELHDQKYLVAAECLKIANIPLPEFSIVIMPASKAFEGFTKKLLVKVGFYSADHFDAKDAKFNNLTDKTFSQRTALTSKEKYAGSYLDKIGLCLDMTRNFMMHSDASTVTKVNTMQEASNKLEEIMKNIKEFFEYFNKKEFGGIYP